MPKPMRSEAEFHGYSLVVTCSSGGKWNAMARRGPKAIAIAALSRPSRFQAQFDAESIVRNDADKLGTPIPKSDAPEWRILRGESNQ